MCIYVVFKGVCVYMVYNGVFLYYVMVCVCDFLSSMGMSHDDDHATCTGHSHIMSGEWVKGRNPSDLSWSPCSRDDLEKFLR